jgi:hypothetical protein
MEWITEITDEHLKRWQKDASYYAEEPVEVEKIKGVLYAYGSELAVRRIEHKFRYSKNASFGYSKSRDSWYFGLELR